MMNLKDKLIRKLLEVGKKHRILVYPTLALVAVISAISHAIYWGKGNGKKLVASAMVMVMLITQSLFLTSSADTSSSAGASNTASGTDAVNVDNANGGDAGDGNIGSDGSQTGEGDFENLDIYEEKDDSINTNLIDSQYGENGEIISQEYDLYSANDTYEFPKMSLAVFRVYSNGTTDGNSLVYSIPYESGIPLTKSDDGNYYDIADVRATVTKGYIAKQIYDIDSTDGLEISDLYFDTKFTEPVTQDKILTTDSHLRQGGLSLYVKAKRTKYDVIITNGLSGEEENHVTYNSLDVIDDKIQFIVPNKDWAAGKIGKWGYKYVGLLSGTTPVADGAYTITKGTGANQINPDGSSNAVYVSAAFEPVDNITIALDAQPDGFSFMELLDGKEKVEKRENLKYTDTITLPSQEEMKAWVKNDGYELTGWRDTVTKEIYDPGETVSVSLLCTRSANVTDEINVMGNSLEAIWTYKKVKLVSNIKVAGGGSAVSYDEAGNLVITAQYGQEIIGDFYPAYATDNNPGLSANFTCEVLSGNIQPYGIEIRNYIVSGDETKIYGFMIGYPLTLPHKVTATGEPKIELKITDNNSINEHGAAEVTYCTVIFKFEKKEIFIDEDSIFDAEGEKPPTKQYNGINTIKLKPEGKVLEAIDHDGEVLYITFNEEAYFDNANAGEKKPLTISNINLEPKDSGLLEYYVLRDKATGAEIKPGGSCTLNIGKITPRAITVTVEKETDSKDPILFGEDRPKFKLNIDTSTLIEADKTAYNNRVSDEAFAREYLGFTDWVTSWEKYKGYLSMPQVYTIKADFSNPSNYAVDSKGVESSFTVNRDIAQKDVNYKFDREPAPNGVYPGLIITAGGGYDLIRLLEDGEDDVFDLDENTVKRLFKPTIDFTGKDINYIDKTFRFQMLNSESGAVTTIENVKLSIDTTGPEYVTHTVSPDLPYFNAFNFGSYYHSQQIGGAEVPNMTITIKYSSEGSAPAELHYRYVDENGFYEIDKDRITDFVNPIHDTYNNVWYADATISIGTSDGGQLIVYATDTTGNDSDPIKLKIETTEVDGKKVVTAIAEDYDGKNTPQNYYEWMVENIPPKATVTATTVDGYAIVDQDNWYNGVTFVASATDESLTGNDSGLNKIEWTVTLPDGTTKTIVDDSPNDFKYATAYGKVISKDFKLTYQDPELPIGTYSATGLLYDNAGNVAELNTAGPFKLDCKPPVIENITKDDPNSLKVGKLLEFNVIEGEGESQISRVELFKEVGGTYERLTQTLYPKEDEGYFMYRNYQILDNGNYKIVAYDKAGNSAEKTISFSGISDEAPIAPTIEVNGTEGKNGWYVETAPAITIRSTTITEQDKIPVRTHYTIVNGEKKDTDVFSQAQKDFNLAEEGNIVIDAWAVSDTSKPSSHATANIKVDLSKPVIEMKESLVDAEGRVTINFVAYDRVSGININSVKLNGNTLIVSENEGTIAGSFLAAGNGPYELTVEDMAGNVATLEFVPLAMSVSPITDITSTGAKIDAKIYVGTYGLSNYYIAYRKAGTTNYETAPANKRTQTYGASLDYEFTDLLPDTVYEYRVYAVTKTSKETKTVEGSFRTGDGKSTTAVYGNVKYAYGISADEPIYVSLFDGNTYIAGKKLDVGGGDYNFTNISDGTYRIAATDGTHTQTKAVIVENGAVVYPTDYITNNGVNFILSNLSTHMVLKDGAVRVAADGLDQVFDKSYTAVISQEDWKAYDEEGASIDVTLYAGYLDVASVSDTTQGVFANNIGKNNVIVRYIELNVVKTVKDADGKVMYTQDVTRLVKPITVAFPLGDLSKQKIGVASMHGTGNNAQFINWSDDDAVLAEDYIAITTSRFSIYALYMVDAAPKSYTVTWKDGDGNTMKVETVTDGGSATPPVTTPRKTATDKYTYTFSGWDTDYSKITKDTIISAWFTANSVGGGSNPGPDNPSDNPGGGDNPNNPEPTPPLITNNPKPQYSYLGSAQSPNTGDEAPIAVLAFVMLLSVSGMIVVIKKQKKH
ncbi:MAG: fibronectin type III domain-containing protein [Clostridium sp.]|nr:fibronectin type III domain-containing protein [Clostridium sp.]